MSKLVAAMLTGDARTENGAVTNSTSGSRLVDFFFRAGAMRKSSEQEHINLFVQAFSEDKLKAIKLLYWLRDVRGGAGERQMFRNIFLSIIQDRPFGADTMYKLLKIVPEYGRWDDLIYLFSKTESEDIKTLITTVLVEGLKEKNGLCAKWMPRKGIVAKQLRTKFNLTPKQYRQMLVKLTNVVETAMCQNTWETINFEHVPSVAASNYKNAFRKHTPELFQKYVEGLVKGDKKVNASAIYPYQIINSLKNSSDKITEIFSIEQWKALPDYLKASGDIRMLPIIDVSGSMSSSISSGSNISCMDVALSIGLYLSEKNKGIFQDVFMSFSTTPRLYALKGNLKQRLSQIVKSEMGYSTNLEAAFNLLLKTAVDNDLTQEDLPTHLVMVSDCEINSMGEDQMYTILQNKFEKAGYKLPNLILWNIQSRHANVLFNFNQHGAGLISGFSPSIFESILGGEMTPIGMMENVINSERYSSIRL